MLGNKKALPLWRRRRPNILSLERALNATAPVAMHSDLEYAVISQSTALRRVEAAKRRFVRLADLR
jgi:hypothetical protein